MKDPKGKEDPFWIVPAQFCVTWYVYDGWCLLADAALDPERVRQARKNIVGLYQTQLLDKASDLTSFGILAIRSKRNVD